MTAVDQGAVVYGVAAAPGGLACLAAHARGLLRSLDGGATWDVALESPDPAQPLPVTAVALAPGFGRGGLALAAAPGAIVGSADGGATWRSVVLPEPRPFVSAIAISPGFARDGVALAATLEDGVFRTADGGQTWAAWNLGLLDHAVLSLALSPDFERDQVAYAGTETGLFRSANGGRFWREVPLPEGASQLLSLACARAGDGELLVAGTSAGALLIEGGQARTLAELDGMSVDAVLLDASGVLALADGRLLLSRDGGATFRPCCAVAAGDMDLTAVAAPGGLGLGEALVVGGLGGEVRRLAIDV